MKPSVALLALLLAAPAVLVGCDGKDVQAPSGLRPPDDGAPLTAPAPMPAPRPTPEIPPSATPGPDAGSALDQAGKAADAARRAVVPAPK